MSYYRRISGVSHVNSIIPSHQSPVIIETDHASYCNAMSNVAMRLLLDVIGTQEANESSSKRHVAQCVVVGQKYVISSEERDLCILDSVPH